MSTVPEPAPESVPARGPAQARPDRRRLAWMLAAWIALVAVALGIAAALDDPPQPVRAAEVPEGLPPLALYLDRGLPPAVARLGTAAEQIDALRAAANATNDPARWVELGAVYHRVQEYREASLAYQRASAIDPARLDARVGLIVIDAATSDGVDRARDALEDLAQANPDSQLVAFNRGMLAVYRSDRDTLVSAFGRARELGPTTDLGRLAGRFLEASGGAAAP